MCRMPVLNTSFLLCLCAVKRGHCAWSQLYSLISALLKCLPIHLSYTENHPTLSENCFVSCLSLPASSDRLFPPQVVLVRGLYPTVTSQTLASSLPLTPFLPFLKCAASQDLLCPMAWMSLFAVVKVTDSGVGMSPSAQVGLSLAKKKMCFLSLRQEPSWWRVHPTADQYHTGMLPCQFISQIELWLTLYLRLIKAFVKYMCRSLTDMRTKAQLFVCLHKTARHRERSRNETPLRLCRVRRCTTGTYSPRHHSNQSFSCSEWLSEDFTAELLISLKRIQEMKAEYTQVWTECMHCVCVYLHWSSRMYFPPTLVIVWSF